ncbi:MAG TPA: aromatic ring-hydroxylating dioxygenase subunit alpha [Candidatus Acidoferrales bacterium]|nr:aromatic ring-hydroxylating dioxygenase subunit alpha [Candidatus Acidoferrales bacterium]
MSEKKLMTLIENPQRPRSDVISYQRLLDTDTHRVPEVLRLQGPLGAGPVEVPVERYTSRAFFELEVERLWKRAWQMACREEDIPNVGDHLVYDIAGMSFIVVRTAPAEIKSYYNACLHRGRMLRETGGPAATEFRCPFHGFAWNLDGSLKHVPCAWDFPHIKPAEWRLPEVKVGTWGGFVFINMDPNCEPLQDFLGAELTDQFKRWPLERRYKQAHVAKVLSCNWKVAQEAFMEAFHVVATHPQLLAGLGDANSQYDAWRNFSRAITANGTPSPHLSWTPTEQQMFDSMTDRRLDEPPAVEIPAGMTARQVSAAGGREMLRPVLGDAVDELSDAELVDSFYYTVFPNFHPWGAYNRITYRFRPHGTEVDESIMECMYLAPYREGEKPPAAPIHWLGADDDWCDAPELGFLARVFNQDTFNLAKVQRGLKTTAKKTVTLANYQEIKLRHFHRTLESWLARP